MLWDIFCTSQIKKKLGKISIFVSRNLLFTKSEQKKEPIHDDQIIYI